MDGARAAQERLEGEMGGHPPKLHLKPSSRRAFCNRQICQIMPMSDIRPDVRIQPRRDIDRSQTCKWCRLPLHLQE
jgi:hypothetical protein